MSTQQWRSRGQGLSRFVWQRVYGIPLIGPRLVWCPLWMVHRWVLAYWWRRDDGTWERVS